MAFYRRAPRQNEGPPINKKCLKFKEIRVVASDGSNLGVMNSIDALTMAQAEGLDLVMIANQAQPPVCKIVDYGKYKYSSQKQQKESKKKTLDVKGVKFRPNTSEHDLGHLLKHAIKFLGEGHKVKFTCQFRAREVTHPEIGMRKMEYVAEQLIPHAIIEKKPSMEGRLMTMILVPKPTSSKKNGEIQVKNEEDSGQEI